MKVVEPKRDWIIIVELMVKVNLLILIFAIVQLVRCDEHFRFSKANENECFPVYISKNKDVKIDLSLIEMEPKTLKSNDNETIIHVTITRGIEAQSSNGDVKENDELISGNVYPTVIKQTGDIDDVYTFNETGYYCMKTEGLLAHSYMLEVTLKDGVFLNLFTRRLILVFLIAIILKTLFIFNFRIKWNNAIKFPKLPYIVKLIIIKNLIDIGVNFLGIVKIIMDFKLGENNLVSNILDYSRTLISLFLTTSLQFYLFQYSGNFTYDLFPFRYAKIFKLLFVFHILSTMMNSNSMIERNKENLLFLALKLIISLVLLITMVVINIRIFTRYRKSVQKFGENNQDPRLIQFKWLILEAMVNTLGIFEIIWYVIHDIIIVKSLSQLSFYKNHYLLDGIYDHWLFYRSDMVIILVPLILNLFIYHKYWTPEYCQKTLVYSIKNGKKRNRRNDKKC